MPCTNPKKCWHYGSTENGKPKYVFKKPPGKVEEQKVPCGRCVSCQMDRSKEWVTRAVHEAQMHKSNCFITLTYSDENLPENGSLDKNDLRQFIKRLRRKFRPLAFKYLAAGEYGSAENTFRPHYHLCIFGIDFPDKKYLFTNKQGDAVYTSKMLLDTWQNKGHVSVGELNYKTAAYTARYTLKKIKTGGS